MAEYTVSIYLEDDRELIGVFEAASGNDAECIALWWATEAGYDVETTEAHTRH